MINFRCAVLIAAVLVGCNSTSPRPEAATPPDAAAPVPAKVVETTSAPPAPVFKIGFVNVKAVLRDYDKTLAINDELRREQDRAEKAMHGLRGQLRALDDGFMRNPPHNPAAARRERAMKAAQIEAHREWTQYELGQRMAQSTVAVYDDLVNVVEAIRVREGYALILKTEPGQIKGADTGLEVNLRINTRGVVAFDPAHDITDAVLREMNRRFERSVEAKGD